MAEMRAILYLASHARSYEGCKYLALSIAIGVIESDKEHSIASAGEVGTTQHSCQILLQPRVRGYHCPAVRVVIKIGHNDGVIRQGLRVNIFGELCEWHHFFLLG